MTADDRAELEGLLGPAAELDTDTLHWTGLRLPGAGEPRRGRAYDPSIHEAVWYCRDARSGLRALIALHSSVLGPGLGGARWRPYADAAEALTDVLRLSAAMTAKSAAAGLDYGGGKAAVIGDGAAKTPELLAAYGRFVERLGGRYVTTTDVGTTTEDLDLIADHTRHIVGLSPARGGSGDTSVLTARTVLNGMRAALRAAFGDGALSGRRVVVVGAGKVGGKVARAAAAEGARVTVADVREGAARALADAIGGEHADPGAAWELPCDVLSPNALGGVLGPESIPRLRCRVVCGGANNQLRRDPADAALLAERGILYAPDYIVNSGGVIQVAAEQSGEGEERARALADRVGETTFGVLSLAEREGITTAEAALRRVDERLAAAR